MSVLDLLRELISKPSITPEDAGSQELVAARLAERGFQIEWINAGGVTNLWATHGKGGPVFCFAGHTDVVPPGPAEAWQSLPFQAAERDGLLFGRGASDMKSGVAAMVVAAESLAEEGHFGTVAVLLTSDEEGPSIDGTRHVLEVLKGRGTTIEAAIVGEPTSEKVFGDAIKVGRRGSMNGVLAIEGRQGHTAYPQLAENAAHKLILAMNRILELDWGGPHPPFQATSLQVTDILCGTGASNVIPGTAEARFNIRFGTNWTADAIQARISEAVSDLGELSWTTGALPFLTRSEVLVESLASSIRGETGVTPKTGAGGGTSDARFFAAHGIPVAEFGPLNASIHAANECVELGCLEPLARIYAGTARQILGRS